MADRAEGGGTWEAITWSGEISGARVPVQVVRVELTLGCAVAAQLFLCSGEELEIETLLCLLSPKLLSQLPDNKFPSCERVLSWNRKANTALIKFQESTWISFSLSFHVSQTFEFECCFHDFYLILVPSELFLVKVFLLIYWVSFYSTLTKAIKSQVYAAWFSYTLKWMHNYQMFLNVHIPPRIFLSITCQNPKFLRHIYLELVSYVSSLLTEPARW